MSSTLQKFLQSILWAPFLGQSNAERLPLRFNTYKPPFLSEKIHFFDLEDPRHLNALSAPALTLEPLQGLIVIDKIQRRLELLSYLRVLCDYSDKRFLILGSASRKLIQQSSETLAGCISYIELTPFFCKEIDDPHLHWLLGDFQKSYLARSDRGSEK